MFFALHTNLFAVMRHIEFRFRIFFLLLIVFVSCFSVCGRVILNDRQRRYRRIPVLRIMRILTGIIIRIVMDVPRGQELSLIHI